MAVAVEVVYHELRVVGAGTDVKAEVDTPELCAVELIAVDDAGGRAAAVGVYSPSPSTSPTDMSLGV